MKTPSFAVPLAAMHPVAFAVIDSSTMVDAIPDDRTLLTGALDWKLTADTLVTFLATYNKGRRIYDYGKPLDGTLLPNRNGPISRDLFVGEPGLDKFARTGSTLGDERNVTFSGRYIW